MGGGAWIEAEVVMLRKALELGRRSATLAVPKGSMGLGSGVATPINFMRFGSRVRIAPYPTLR